MLGALGLGQRERQHARADHRFEVAHGHPQRPVDAHHDIGAAARHRLHRLRHQRPRPVLLRGRDRILEIEDDRVGAAPRRAVDKAALGDRHKQQRAPDGQIVVHARPS